MPNSKCMKSKGTLACNSTKQEKHHNQAGLQGSLTQPQHTQQVRGSRSNLNQPPHHHSHGAPGLISTNHRDSHSSPSWAPGLFQPTAATTTRPRAPGLFQPTQTSKGSRSFSTNPYTRSLLRLQVFFNQPERTTELQVFFNQPRTD